jgi:hypothetical protein
MPPTEARLADNELEPVHVRAVPRLARPVLVVHSLSLIAAFGVWAYLDRNLWFFGDEWDFLTRRGLHGAYFSIWTPHNEHWSVLPILLWRAIYSLEHLSSYWPYLIPLLLAHVAVVHLLWRRCLREGVGPWIATCTAVLFGLLGAGAEDLAWAFQIGFVGSVLFGLLAMEVAEGPPSAGDAPFVLPDFLVLPTFRASARRRDVAASLLALGALMCSMVGVAAGAALGVLLLGRFGWQRAARVLAMPAVAFAVWFVLAGRSGLKATGDSLSPSVFLKIPTFVASNLTADVGKAAGWASGGPVLAVALLAWVVWRSWGPEGLFKRHPAVLGGVIAAMAFYALAAVGRDRISATEAPSRYAYVGIAFLLPAFALALTNLANLFSRGRSQAFSGRLYLRAAILAVLVLATISNTEAGIRFVRSRTVYVRGLENQIITSAALLQSPSQLASAINPYPIWASGFASGYLMPQMLASLYRERLLPKPSPALMTQGEILNDETWLDVTNKRPPFRGAFHLLSAYGVTWSVVPPTLLSSVAPAHKHRSYNDRAYSDGAEDRAYNGGAYNDRGSGAVAWPKGPGECEWATASGSFLRRQFPPLLRFGLAAGSPSGSLWVSLGKAGGKVLASLAEPIGSDGLPGPVAMDGEAFQLGSDWQTWVDDSAGSDDLVLQLAPGSTAEICGLAPTA